MTKILSNSIVQLPTDLISGVTTNSIEDRSSFFSSEEPVTWTGTELIFTKDIVYHIVNAKSGTATAHTIPKANSPLQLLTDGAKAWIVIDRTIDEPALTFTTGATIPAQSTAAGAKDIIVFGHRIDAASAGYLHLPFHKQVLNPGQTVRLGASGSGEGSGGAGGELVDLRFRAQLVDSFTDLLDGKTPTDISLSPLKTQKALHSIAKAYFRFSYDARWTVTGTGMSMTLSGAVVYQSPYVLSVGDVLIVGDEVRAITQVSPLLIESAFSVDPVAADCCVSQCIHTVDLNDFDNGGLGIAMNTQFTDDVSSILVGYEDSLADLVTIPALGTLAHVAFSASGDGADWSTKRIRPLDLSVQATELSVPTPGANLYIRFFANKVASYGQVNLLGFKAFWHKEYAEQAGVYMNEAFANLADGHYQNCAHSVVAGKSRFTFTFDYSRGLNVGDVSGSALEVFINGQQIPRFEYGVNATDQAYFKEINGNTIELDIDYTVTGLQMMFKVPRPVIDSRTENTTRITALENNAYPIPYTLTVAGTGWTTTQATGIPYRLSDGTWRMRFNISGTTPSVSIVTVAITGASAAYAQAIAAYGSQLANASITGANIYGYRSSVGTDWYFSGDIALSAVPSFV